MDMRLNDYYDTFDGMCDTETIEGRRKKYQQYFVCFFSVYRVRVVLAEHALLEWEGCEEDKQGYEQSSLQRAF